jgi:hypothetical protein
VPARLLVTAIAGSQEQVDQRVEIAKSAAVEGLVRSGAAGGLLGGVPFEGAALGMLGGTWRQEKDGRSGPARRQEIHDQFRRCQLRGAGAAANASGYQSNKNDERLIEAFVLAFNQLVAQREVPARSDGSSPCGRDCGLA